MRYEHIDLDLSTADCDLLLKLLTVGNISYGISESPDLMNLANEIRARLQRRDVDIQCPKNAVMAEDWLDA